MNLPDRTDWTVPEDRQSLVVYSDPQGEWHVYATAYGFAEVLRMQMRCMLRNLTRGNLLDGPYYVTWADPNTWPSALHA